MATDALFTSVVVSQTGLSGTGYTLAAPLSNNTLYYWRVNATNVGGTSSYSSTWSFTTIVAAPAAPTLSSPSNGATGVSTSSTLSWNSSTGAASYRLQVSTNSSFTSLVYDQSGITGTSQQVSGLSNNTLYYWRMNATNAGGTSGWSAPFYFTTVPSAPDAPILLSPANNAVGTPTSVTLTWSNVPGALTYRVQLLSSSTFATLLRDTSVLSATTLWVDGLANGTKYYWKVYASNAGGSSPWTAVWNFTTVIPAPARPVLVSPPTGSTTVPIVSAALTWNPSVGALSYRVQLSPNASFNPSLVDTSGVTGTSLNLPRLLSSTDYFWQVMASNDGGWSDWSDISAFRTVAVSGVFADGTIPDRFDLRQNFPNPFNPTTEIVFSLPDQSHVQILIYDSFGELVRSIVEGEFAPGVYHVKWDGMNSSSRQVPSGLYFCRMATPKASFTKRMVLLK